MDEKEDVLGRLRAEMDQTKEGAREFASLLWAYYDQLRQEGFSEEQAFMLVLSFQATSLGGEEGE